MHSITVFKVLEILDMKGMHVSHIQQNKRIFRTCVLFYKKFCLAVVGDKVFHKHVHVYEEKYQMMFFPLLINVYFFYIMYVLTKYKR